ncbi:K(+) efflux antiporter 2, chloroplastic [Linum perenne]
MDFACGVYQPNSFHGCEGTSYRVLSRLHSRFAYRSLNHESIDWNNKSSRRTKKAVVYSNRLNSSLISISGLHSHWWGGHPNNSLFSSSCDTVRAPTGLKRHCQGKDSLAYIDGNGRNVELEKESVESSRMDSSDSVKEEGEEKEADMLSLDELRELLQKAIIELEVARSNSAMFEEKAQKISEVAIALKDDAATAWNDVDSALDAIQQIVNEESVAKEAAQKATASLSLAEARLKVAIESSKCEAELKQLQNKKEEMQRELDRLKDVADKVHADALKAEEEVGSVMLMAEQAVAVELEAAQRVNFAEIALHRADFPQIDDTSDQENDQVTIDRAKESEIEIESTKKVSQTRKQELQKDTMRERESPPSPFNGQKASLKKSSRFFSASFFSSFTVDGAGFTPALVFQSIMESAKNQLPKLVVGLLLAGGGVALYSNRVDRSFQMLQQSEFITSSIEEVSSSAKPLIVHIKKFPKKVKQLLAELPQQEINEEEASLFDVLWLLLASVIFVPIFQKIPGGSPVLGYLAAGILIGPYGLSIIRNVHGTKAIAEFGVVFLLFNIGLELSVERLSSMKKYVFGLGSAQVLVTAITVGLAAHFLAGLPGPAAIVIGNGLALSSTAVVLQVLQERGESTSRHGRATFSVLLFQDLAVVVLLILIPLISPNSSKGGIGFQAIAEALGVAAVKAAVAITAIIAGGRLLLRPIYRQIAENQNAEIFSANTLLVILGTSLLTARAGLSMALGAFLAGLLLAETEFSLQVESDIAPYRGLLLGLFFMTVGMSIDPKLLLSNFPVIMGTLGLLIGWKTLLVTIVGKVFGVSLISAIRVGLLLAPGGEFAFVAFGEAVSQGIMSPQLSSLLFLVVGISMAITPWLAAGGQLIASRFELQDVRSLLPVESETDDLQDHIIICGFGRVGQIIAQLLSERLIPFVAIDVGIDRVTLGRALDLPVYFGDAGSREVLHKVGAERACAAAITLDTPGANYRTVWALSKYFPNVKTFVRAHDVDHGLNLEKAGASAVVPETLEPSLQLAAAVLAQAKLPASEIAATINEFRSRHLSELTELSEASGSSLGYGFTREMSKPKAPQPSDSSDENQITTEGTVAV